MSLSYSEIIQILKIVRESDCDSLEIQNGDFRLSFKKGEATIDQAVPSNTPVPVATNPQTDAVVPPLRSRPEPRNGESVYVDSPMVGHFYRSSVPGAPPFVEVGHFVHSGDPVAIIEVMKLMNTIPAPCSGVVVAIFPQNEQLVEFGEPLIEIEPRREEEEKVG